MENYVVSARKYRPQTFEAVVGQRAIVMTLKNAIKSNQVAQAFLFCGSRGVGKTSTARILAKTLNCTSRTPETEACNTCPSCESFNQGSSLNVYEMDAASNNGADHIRSLIDQVRIAPQLGSHKVYIIDEVHMLSQAGFNAFLKTLEEPPKHAIFILATTEKHKIIPTILSRCQIFDFNRIKVNDIAKHLEGVAQKENISAESEALYLIAQKADGALRDSLSIFDQIVSFTQGQVTYQAVLENLNVLDYDYFFKIVDFAENENIPGALILYNDIMEKGYDGHNFLSGLSTHYRNLLVAKDPASLSLLEVSDTVVARYAEQSSGITSHTILRSIYIIQKAETEFKASKNQRLLVEWTLMQLCSIKQESEKKNS